jgi:methionyl aminopeptidase
VSQIKTTEDLIKLREGGKRLAQIIHLIGESIQPGVTGSDINDLAIRLAKESGDEPAFLNYKPQGAPRPFPGAVCVSVNDEVVHGIPNETEKILKEGDIVTVDMGLVHEGLITDMAWTYGVGAISEEDKKLMRITQEALFVGIKAARGGSTTGDVGFAIESFVKPHGFGIPEELGGHGVGHHVHEEPFVPNFGRRGQGAVLLPGMVIALEPMLNLGSRRIVFERDGYTVRTADGSKSAHFEHTIIITEGEAEIVTRL